MKTIITTLLLIVFFCSCNASKEFPSQKRIANDSVSDTIRIANDELEYEVVIIDPGFSSWLASRAFPRNYLQSYLENKIWEDVPVLHLTPKFEE
jgi:hypothetical protein